jgi:hypothetical protein
MTWCTLFATATPAIPTKDIAWLPTACNRIGFVATNECIPMIRYTGEEMQWSGTHGLPFVVTMSS